MSNLKKTPQSMTRSELIQEINLLGPWIHGYFDLGNDLVIEEQDELHKKRITTNRDYFVNIISNFYKRDLLEEKTICDVGCNAGYFLYELYKKFKFKRALGLEPRKSNLAKAQFIANYFQLPEKSYELRQFDILTNDKNLPISDIVIIPGVLHHLSNHFNAISNLYAMTRELCIVETYVLPDYVNSDDIFKKMSLGETLYKSDKNKDKFGIIGYKLETNRLDGSAYQSGIVGVSTTRALIMMMKHVGFDDVKVYRNEQQIQEEVYNQKSYREFNSVIVVATKTKNKKNEYAKFFDNAEDLLEEEYFTNYIPLKLIEPLYQVFIEECSIDQLDGIPRLIYDSELFYKESKGEKAKKSLEEKIGINKYYEITQTFKHSPKQKISFEYAKTCYHVGNSKQALKVAQELINTINLDWRTVFRAYYLIAKINFDLGNMKESKKFNELSLRAHPLYSLGLKLKKMLISSPN